MNTILYLEKTYLPILNKRLEQFFLERNIPNNLREAILYSLQTGGKRLRPLLVFVVLAAYKNRPEKGIDSACALEMIHTYSLVHDDLPAMDNDDFRRGELTNHKVYGEAMAILAGDALQTAAFEIIAIGDVISVHDKIAIIRKLALASGAEGMVGGQVLDMYSTPDNFSLDNLQQMHSLKTGRLIECCVDVAAHLANVNSDEATKLHHFAHLLGIAFQIQDDILDVACVGVNGREIIEKCTYPSLLTLNGAKEELNNLRQKMIEVVKNLNCEYGLLIELIKHFIDRKY